MISNKLIMSFILGMLFVFLGSPLWATGAAIGVVKNITGTAVLERGPETILICSGDRLFEGDTIVTAKGASLGIIFHDNGVLSLGPDTQFVVESYAFSPADEKLGMISRVFKGSAIYLSGLIGKLKKDSILFKTPTATCGIRGTQIAINVDNYNHRSGLPKHSQERQCLRNIR